VQRRALELAGLEIAILLTGTGSSGAAAAQQAGGRDEQIVVVANPGGDIDFDDAIALGRSDIARTGRPDLLGALTRDIAGVTLQDAQNNPWQPNLVYRGFIASPLQGQSQGLAVYLDGGRFNQPFGDTVDFDLIPDAALHSASLLDASPAYGLNALGGALVLETATGRTDPGLDAAVSLGSYGEREASLSGGGAAGAFSYFGAFQYRREDGWRDFSPSELTNGYADLGFDRDWGGVHAKFVAADTDLTGNGVSPVELLAARRASVFTWPDNTKNRYGRISLHPWLKLGEDTRLEATFYRQRLQSDSINGDAADIEECDDAAGTLCLETVGEDDDDGSGGDAEPVTDAQGKPVPDTLDGAPYGVLNRGSTHTRSLGALAQVVDRRALLGGTNRLALGFSYDGSTTDFATSTELGALTEQRGVDGLGVEIVQGDGSIAPVGVTADTRYWGAFLADSLPLGSRLTAEIGLRYNWARIRLTDRIGTALNGEHRFERLNPGLEFDWQAASGLTLRAGYAEANRAPTPAELSCADPEAPCSLANFFVADPALEQVVSRSWELGAAGAKSVGGWSIRHLLSLYRSDIADDIHYVASDVRGRAYFQNLGDTRRQGVELSLAAQRSGLRLAASYAFTDATFRSGLTLPSPSNPEADDDGTIAVEPGDRLPGIPRHSLTLSADYEGGVGTRRFSLGGDVIARSSQMLVGDEANLTPPVPGYVTLNLRASIEIVPHVALFAELRNAFDADYATFGTFSEVDEVALAEAPGASNPRAYGPGQPRRGSIGLRAAF
jgi:outer membrane receptor protein involved in Fe transport